MASRKTEFIITCNGTNVQAVIEGIDRALAALVKEERDLLALTQKQGYATKEQKKRMRELESGIDALRGKYQQNVNEMKKYGEVMKDLAGAKTKDLKRALQECKRALDNMSAKSAGRQNLINDMQKIQKQIDANTASTKKFGATSNSVWQTAVRNITAYVGVMAGFNKLKTLVEGVFSANVKLSDSLADIRKVSGLAMSDINKLYENLSKIDSRNTVETLNKLAYTGAKLGIGQNYGVEGLTGFVKAAEQVQMALGEDMGEEALPALAKMTEVMGLIDKYGVEQSMQKAASAIFQLGATSTATGTEIVEFSKRLYGLANVSRISAQDLLALGSSASAMGLMPEVASTAFNKLFTSIQKNHNMIEKTLGLQEGLIKNYYTQGKTMDAVVAIFDKMNKTGNLNLLGSVFKDLGSDGARLVNVMATMSDRVDILKKHLEVSRDAFKEGEAVIGEYMIQNQTAAAMLERASNLWVKAFVNPEGVDMVKELAEAWYEVSKSLTQSDAMMQSLRSSISAVATGIGYLIKLLPLLIRFGLTLGTVYGFKAAISGVSALFTSFRSLYTSVLAANGALATTQALLKSNAFVLAVSGIASLITLLIDYTKAADEAAKREVEHQAKLREAYNKSRDAVNNCVKPLESYKRALEQANLSEEQKMQLVKDFKNAYQDYLDYLGIEVNSALDLANAYGMVVKVMKQKKAYEERENYRTEVNGQNRMDRISAQAKVEAEARTLGIEGANKAYLESTQNVKSGNKIMRRGSEDVLVELLKKKYGDNVGISASGELYRIETIDRNLPASAANQRITNIGVNANGLRNAIRNYIQSFREEKKTDKEINDMFNAEYQEIGLAGFDLDEFNRKVQEARWKRKGTLENDAPDKNAAKELRKQQQDYKQQLRKDLKDAKEESDAIISKIEEWYRLQETVLTDMAADGRLTQEQADQAIRTLNIAKNQALRDARLAISGRDTAAWEKTKQQIGNFMIDQGEWSQQLLAQILDVSMKSIRDNLSRIDKGGGQFGITTSSLRDAVDKNAAGNQREIARLMNKSSEEVEKLLERYNYLEQATKLFEKNLVQIGVLSITAEQLQNQLQGVPDAKATTDATMSMLAALLQQGTKLFAVNPSDATAVAEAIREVVYKPLTESDYLAGRTEGQQAKWFDMFPAIKDWMANPEKHKQELENFYNVVLIAEQDYYTKRKQSYQNASKQMENRFRAAGYTDQEQRIDTQLQGEATTRDNGIGATFWEQQGLGSIADDPEIKRIQNRIYWRQKEVDAAEESLASLKEKQAEEMQLARDRQASDEELQEIEREQALARMGLEDLLHEKKTALFERETELTSKVAQELQKRIQTINNLTKPVQDAANNVGKKLGEMIAGAKEESITWEQIWKSMAIAVGESVIDMMAAYAQNLIMEKAMNAQSKSEAIEKAEVDVAAGTASAASKTLGTLGWLGIALIPVIAALLKGLLQSAFATANKNGSSNTKVKLVSGMLTYDEGNVGQYVGNDGNVYTARQQSSVPEGVSLVSQPIATTINGQPSLVAEKGPEIVIGRRTTRQIMMNEPALLHHLANYGGGGMRRLYDEGNVGDIIGNDGTLDMTGGSGSRGVLDGETAAALRALPAAMAAFSQMMGTIQKQGIPAKMARFGEGSLDEGMRDVEDYRRRYPRS